ncbi:radical SAM protein [Polyangium spumosum]|uniref:Radical SAM protein n=1 Tax=Polyangium spumosum TaxID=889282 RepID=A0A6N7PXG2_9BACT|nr:radical SAM protein [Polyangium spumosum]
MDVTLRAFGRGAIVTAPAPRRLPIAPAQAETAFADFQNEALLAGAEGEGKTLAHEAAAHEKRNWVRLSYDCNNHCTFCLDSNAHDGTMRATQDIKVQIVEGRRRGADRLILSGGEPTMHPNFLDFVKLGRLAGYRKVQTVTNGRMFRYPDFLEKAADNGLHEITFSLHGHTAKLHDALVGTPGAFVEEVAGLKAALASERFIVNVDIVINKQNVRHLPEMLSTFIGWGVKEFDLLHVIPFGNAWSDARHHLFYDLDGNLEYLQQAFAYARRPDIHIWLNRFPPPYAEGFEDLIQDPYKLNDEVRGRREEFDRYLSLGKKLMCREPERCKYCYLESLCDTLDEVIDVRKAEEVDVLRYAGEPPRAGKLPEARVARIVATNLAEAAALAAKAAPGAITLELASYEGLSGALSPEGQLFGKQLVACYTDDPAAIEPLLGIAGPFEVRAFLTKATEAVIRRLEPPPKNLVLVQKNYDLVSDAHANDVDTKSFFATYPHMIPVENVPACLAGRPVRTAPRTLDLAMLGADARIDMTEFTKRYVADGFYTKALRCKDCRENASCRGVHVNWVRAHGFGALEPMG